MKRRTFLGLTTLGPVILSNTAQAETLPEPTKVPGEASATPQTTPSKGNFSFDALSTRMQAKAKEAFESPKITLPEAFQSLSYQDYYAIRFDPNQALWRDDSNFQLQFYPLGWLFQTPVEIFEIVNGQAQPLSFEASQFLFEAPLDPNRFKNVEFPGVAGFKMHYPLNREDVSDEVVSFLGSSYFRAVGQGNTYGLSARGLAINTATNQQEEFPLFTAFYVEKPKPDTAQMIVYATLESPSVTGAYRFVIQPGKHTRMDVTSRLFFRQDIERLGIAPMTSMFLFGPANRHAFDDYRTRVHDSEGLKIIRSDGTELWRSLQNARSLANAYFTEKNPRAFGLYQRHRHFSDYQDANHHYERRPSLLIEPRGEWGQGNISLVEIPTTVESNDNIVAFWQPETPIKAGQAAQYDYRLTWGSLEEDRVRLARVKAIRTGEDISATPNPKQRKLIVDFEGGALDNLTEGTQVSSRLSVTHAKIHQSRVFPVPSAKIWRLMIDLEPEGDAPMEFVGALTDGSKDLSEIWLYQMRADDAQPIDDE